MSRYAWIIDGDPDPITVSPMAKPCGPRTAPEDQIAKLRRDPHAGRQFRMRDDDGELVYVGRIINADPGSEDDFAPLDEFGQGDSGCTSVEYLNDNGRWDTL